MHFARISFPALLVLGLAACSSSSSKSSGPVIDDFGTNDTATVGSIQTTSGTQQAYDIDGKISFHDDSENVTQYKVHVDIPGAVVQDLQQGIPATKSAVNQEFHLYLDQNAPKGKITVTVTIYGASGVASSPASHDVTLQ